MPASYTCTHTVVHHSSITYCTHYMYVFQTPPLDLSEDSREFLDSESEFQSPINSPAVHRHDLRHLSHHDQHQVEVVEVERAPGSPGLNRMSSTSSQGAKPYKSAPSSPIRQPHGPARGHQSMSRGSTPSPNMGGRYGYIPNSVYSTRTSYRNQMYPTFTTRSHSASSNQSEYDNYNGAGAGSNRQHVSRVEQENNLYNVNTYATTRYDSTDELKSPPPTSEEYDSYYEGHRWPSKHGSLEGAYKRSQSQEPDGRHYGSLERNSSRTSSYSSQPDPNVMLDELTPSKFGCKRESVTDSRDSPYQPVEMPPFPSNPAYHGHSHHPQYAHHNHGDGDPAQHNTSIPFIDSSQQSVNSSGSSNSPYWYESQGSIMRQQAPPHTPQFESPPTPAIQQEVMQMPHYDGTSAASQESPLSQQQKVMHVMKYQNYVEVSKPFEMSDFYKYSERIRKQRHSEQHSPGSGGQTASPRHSSVSSQGGGGPPPPSGQSRSRPTSRPSSPSHQGQNYGQYRTPPSPYQGKRPVHGHGSHPGTPSGYPAQHSPQHISYQPPQPMTCSPVVTGDQQSAPPSSQNTPHSQC